MMRLFQNASLYPTYRMRLRSLSADCSTYAEHLKKFLTDRYGAMHILQPVLQHRPEAFFANGDYDTAQKVWASEQGMPRKTNREDILLAQIEQHRTEVFYNTDPITFPSEFVKRLPGSVKHRIAWRAAPSGKTDFRAYDLMVCNFPGILEGYRKGGMRAAYFSPACDPDIAPYADNHFRPIDVVFIGSFSRHHSRRTEILNAVAGLSSKHAVAIHLESSRLTTLAESRIGRCFVPSKYRRPPALRKIAKPPAFGRDLYKILSSAKIVVNAAIDMAGQDRGNIRCFETMGAGALLLSDVGRYPAGMEDGVTMRTYSDIADLIQTIESLLSSPDKIEIISRQGHNMFAHDYSKERQWADFTALVGDLEQRHSA